MHRYPLLGGEPKPPAPRSTAVDVLTGLAQVVIAVIAYLQLQTPRAWWILALGAVWLGVAFRHPLWVWVIESRHRKGDERTARRAMPQLRSLTRAFAKLVSPPANDTLQAVLQEAFRNHHGILDALHVPSGHLFDEMTSNLSARIDGEPADAAHLLRALAELHTIVRAHSTQCIEPVFRHMPKEAQDALTPGARAALNSVRERYLEFLGGFTRFTEDLGASLQASKLHVSYYVFRPDALTA